MRVFNDKGEPYDASIDVTKVGDAFSVTFESRGGGRNMDYIPAFRVALARMAAMRGVLVDARLVTGDTRHLPLDDRRLKLKGLSYPLRLGEHSSLRVASLLRTAQGYTARKPGAKGSGNRTKRTELIFSVDDVGASLAAVTEQLLNPTCSIEETALIEYVNPPQGLTGQGFLAKAEDRVLAEAHAMRSAIEYFKNLGAQVEDVSRYECFDLRCTINDSVFDVEVKGTTTAGKSILLTANEVKHAMMRSPHMGLYVLSDIKIQVIDGKRVASGGEAKIYQPWRLDEAKLKAATFTLSLQ